MPNEMALATAMSSDSTRYFCVVVDAAASKDSPDLSSFTASFLRRLLLEKADFKADRDLGYAVVALYSETFFLSGSQLRLPFAVESEGFSEFLKLQPVRSSVHSALLLGKAKEQSDGALQITWPAEPRRFRKQRCLIDRNFIEHAGIDRETLATHNKSAAGDGSRRR